MTLASRLTLGNFSDKKFIELIMAFSSLTNLKIGIYGLGKTGTAAYKALKDKADTIICYDEYLDKQQIATTIKEEDFISLENSKWQGLDKILISPGVPPSHQIFSLASSCSIPIVSDIDLLFEECSHSNFIAITGTNGKSTTTALISHILSYAGLDYPPGGNIGNPALTLPLNKPGYVLELSSFQLELLNSFKAKIAVLLNITPDHLDRHKTMETYIKAKESVFMHQDSSCFSIANIDSLPVKNLLANKLFTSTIIPISAKELVTGGVTVLPGVIYDNISVPLTFSLPANKFLLGSHNHENIAASYAACRAARIEPALIIEAINAFTGLPHRMQYIGVMQNIHFYNDSKATNGEAASKSISTLDNIYWLAGGIAKTEGVKAVLPYANKIRKAYLFGQDKQLFAQELDGAVAFQLHTTLAEAFAAACHDATADLGNNKSVLLAPAASSYDQFKNFEDRGNVFVHLCQTRLNNNNSSH